MPFGVAIETDGDEIFDNEPCIGKSFEIFLRGSFNLTFGCVYHQHHSNVGQREVEGRDGTFRRIGAFALAMSFGVAIKTGGDEIFDNEPCIGKSFEILLRGSRNLTFGSAKRQGRETRREEGEGEGRGTKW